MVIHLYRCIAMYRCIAVSCCIVLYRAVSLYPDIRLCDHVCVTIQLYRSAIHLMYRRVYSDTSKK